MQDQLGKAKEENANKSIELRNMQMDLGRVNSELVLSQRESDERSRVLQETLNKLDNMRNTVKDANEINSYKAKELKDKEQELLKLTEELRASKAENEQRIKELEDNQKLLNSTLQNLAKSDEVSRIKGK